MMPVSTMWSCCACCVCCCVLFWTFRTNHESQQRQGIHFEFSSESRRHRLRPVPGGSPGTGCGWWPHLPYDPWEDAACLSLWRCLFTFSLWWYKKNVIYFVFSMFMCCYGYYLSITKCVLYGVFYSEHVVWCSVYCKFGFLQPSIYLFKLMLFGMVEYWIAWYEVIDVVSFELLMTDLFVNCLFQTFGIGSKGKFELLWRCVCLSSYFSSFFFWIWFVGFVIWFDLICLLCLFHFSDEMQASGGCIVASEREQKWVWYRFKWCAYARYGWI